MKQIEDRSKPPADPIALVMDRLNRRGITNPAEIDVCLRLFVLLLEARTAMLDQKEG